MSRLSILFIITISCVLSSCAHVNSFLDNMIIEEPHHEHVVRHQGETLAVISNWYTGSPDNWKAIQQYNVNLDPRRIKIGQRIKIPSQLVTNRQKLPKRRTATASRKQQRTPPHYESHVPPQIAQQPVAKNEDAPHSMYELTSVPDCEQYSGDEAGLNDCAETLNKKVNAILSTF